MAGGHPHRRDEFYLVSSTLRGIKLPLSRWTVPLALPIEKIGQVGARDSTSTSSSSKHPKNRTARPRAHGFRCQSPCWYFWSRQTNWMPIRRHGPASYCPDLCLANRGDPRSDLYSPELGLVFTRLYHSYKNEDPAPKPRNWPYQFRSSQRRNEERKRL